MNRIYQYIILLFFLILTSCSDTICDEGYEGENCETETRTKFIGKWIANDWSCNASTGEIIVDFTHKRDQRLMI
ncbi:MAG: hypothetical protein ACJA1A_002191 [Saprospiraceae bacterium]|jgi:hypothetical protein